MDQSAERRLKDLLEGFDTAMLITHGMYGTLNGRPMRVAEISEAGELYFVTSASSSKVKEVENDSDVTLIFQNQKTFISLNGKASVVKDRARVEKLWLETWKLWFPKGKTDESIRLLKISPVDAEYWDNSGVQAISYAFEAAKAYIKGVTPASSAKQHGKIAM
jgi:general stress protein 26